MTAPADSGKSTAVTAEPAAIASVTYTRPASACPLVTLVSTSLTCDSSLAATIRTPAADSTFLVAAPHGTCGAQTTTVTPGRSKDRSEVTFFGLPGATARPPAPGIGIPRKFYILSNNHVLANSNKAKPGDTILQPGPYDGGVDPTDRIGILDRFVPITFDPPVPRHMHRNLVDAALAEGQFHDLDREVYWIGYVRGWRRKAKIGVGDIVQKTGRTTNFTIGRITVINATVDVGYGGGRVARFRDQILTTNMGAPGDSGSLVTTLDNVAVGLLFAGSSAVTIVNQIENVRSLLRVEIAEQIL